ncbi:DNA repair protein RadC [Segetibacter sp. 3557_3]|uniref:RadC family protein n=1 Tax=Segetibacter sp. 3557_3 TaxID=2547429 RepID=UPI001058B07B|nr:DNA repair protein RadC [Segetibacter sp. 3557_3]TDH25505.1 DNA repair protein RadC [Segetibacter sp. 3557_3]
MEKQTIKNWAADDRPREKLMQKGSGALSNSELLAILILNGSVDKSAVDLAKELLGAVQNDLNKLGRLSVKDMVNLKLKGLGPAKAVSIAAALELGIRRKMAETKKEVILSSRDLAEYLRAQFEYKKHEIFAVVFLNRANKIRHFEVISEGGITGTVADPRIILRKALEHDAVNIVLCHNHPSGSLKPSRQDEELTQKIKEAARYFDIRVMDHLIVSDEGYFSFADDGIL